MSAEAGWEPWDEPGHGVMANKEPMEPLHPGTELRDRYPFECPGCGRAIEAAPSALMACFGYNQGAVECPGCDRRTRVRIDDANRRMEALGG